MGTRRTYTNEFKHEAIKLVIEQGLSRNFPAQWDPKLGIHVT